MLRSQTMNKYECNHCSKSYAWSHDLKRHVKTKHAEQTQTNTSEELLHVSTTESLESHCDNIMFYSPTTITLSGSTGSGKTSLLLEILKYRDELFSSPPKKIMYCYGVWQEMYDKMEQDLGIQFHEGLPSEQIIDEFVDSKHNMIIFDDLMDQVVDSCEVQHLFTRGSHHKNLTIIFINQNLFCQGKYSRTMSVNSHYLFLLNNPRGVTSISILGRQIGMSKTLSEAYQDSVLSKPYGYLLVDLSPHNPTKYKLKTNIFPHEDTIVYIPL